MGYRDCELSEIGAPRSIEAAELLTSRDKSDSRTNRTPKAVAK
jgi:hypothetical protein